MDDVAEARRNIRSVLKLRPELGVQVIGEADTGEAALQLVRDLCPDVVFLDIGLPDVSGLEVARRIKLLLPRVTVIVVTGHDDPAYRREATALGVAGYVTKDNLWDVLPETVGRALRPA